jgi:hypothetical protein
VKATFEARIKDESVYPALDAIADHLNHTQRHLFVDRYVHLRPSRGLKREYIVRFGVTARQFNAISNDLQGKVNAARKAVARRIRGLRGRISHLRGYVCKLQERTAKEGDPDRRSGLRFLLHQKKRHLGILKQRLDSLREEKVRPVPGICFGSRRVFGRQFFLKENGYRHHAEWLLDWRAERHEPIPLFGEQGREGRKPDRHTPSGRASPAAGPSCPGGEAREVGCRPGCVLPLRAGGSQQDKLRRKDGRESCSPGPARS